MNGSLLKKITSRSWQVPDWVWEILLVVTVTPALVHAVLSLGTLPAA